MSDTRETFLEKNTLLWAWIPGFFLISQIIAELTLPEHVLQTMNNENGLIELLQVVIISIAFVVALTILVRGWKTMSLPLKFWIGIAMLGCVYIAGEEVSWGQHFFDWGTPEAWQSVNDQQETNLHNTSSWFDQKPRLILLIGAVVGGLILPLLNKFKPSVLPERFRSIYPEARMWIIALILLGLKIADKIAESVDTSLFVRISEIEEAYLYYFILVYLLAMHYRLITKAVTNLQSKS